MEDCVTIVARRKPVVVTQVCVRAEPAKKRAPTAVDALGFGPWLGPVIAYGTSYTSTKASPEGAAAVPPTWMV